MLCSWRVKADMDDLFHLWMHVSMAGKTTDEMRMRDE